MAVNYDGLTRNEWPGTWSPSGNHPISINNEGRGGVQSVAGTTGDELTDIPGQRLDEGMLVWDATAELFYQYRIQSGDAARDASGRLPNATANWVEFESGGGGIDAWDNATAYNPGDVIYYTTNNRIYYGIGNTEIPAGTVPTTTASWQELSPANATPNLQTVLGVGNSANDLRITSVGNPIANGDAVNKQYADNASGHTPGGGVTTRLESLDDVDVTRITTTVTIVPAHSPGIDSMFGDPDQTASVAYINDGVIPERLVVGIPAAQAGEFDSGDVGEHVTLSYSDGTNTHTVDLEIAALDLDATTGLTVSLNITSHIGNAITDAAIAQGSANEPSPYMFFTRNTITRITDSINREDDYFVPRRATDGNFDISNQRAFQEFLIDETALLRWTSEVGYAQNDEVLYEGEVFRASDPNGVPINATTIPPRSTLWTRVDPHLPLYDGATTYYTGDVVYYTTSLTIAGSSQSVTGIYRAVQETTGNTPINLTTGVVDTTNWLELAYDANEFAKIQGRLALGQFPAGQGANVVLQRNTSASGDTWEATLLNRNNMNTTVAPSTGHAVTWGAVDGGFGSTEIPSLQSVSTPTADTHAANKGYVDDKVGIEPWDPSGSYVINQMVYLNSTVKDRKTVYRALTDHTSTVSTSPDTDTTNWEVIVETDAHYLVADRTNAALPSDPDHGDVWFNCDDGKTYMWYENTPGTPSSGQWIQTAGLGEVSTTSGTGSGDTNQDAFSSVLAGTDTLSADNPTDQLVIRAASGSPVTVTGNTTDTAVQLGVSGIDSTHLDITNNKATGTDVMILRGEAGLTNNAFEWYNLTDAIEAHNGATDLSVTQSGAVVTIASSTGTNATIVTATPTTTGTVGNAGTMSPEDKAKLDGIETGAELNVRSNWDETDTTDDAYIENKPNVPTGMLPTGVTAWSDLETSDVVGDDQVNLVGDVFILEDGSETHNYYINTAGEVRNGVDIEFSSTGQGDFTVEATNVPGTVVHNQMYVFDAGDQRVFARVDHVNDVEDTLQYLDTGTAGQYHAAANSVNGSAQAFLVNDSSISLIEVYDENGAEITTESALSTAYPDGSIVRFRTHATLGSQAFGTYIGEVASTSINASGEAVLELETIAATDGSASFASTQFGTSGTRVGEYTSEITVLTAGAGVRAHTFSWVHGDAITGNQVDVSIARLTIQNPRDVEDLPAKLYQGLTLKYNDGVTGWYNSIRELDNNAVGNMIVAISDEAHIGTEQTFTFHNHSDDNLNGDISIDLLPTVGTQVLQLGEFFLATTKSEDGYSLYKLSNISSGALASRSGRTEYVYGADTLHVTPGSTDYGYQNGSGGVNTVTGNGTNDIYVTLSVAGISSQADVDRLFNARSTNVFLMNFTNTRSNGEHLGFFRGATFNAGTQGTTYNVTIHFSDIRTTVDPLNSINVQTTLGIYQLQQLNVIENFRFLTGGEIGTSSVFNTRFVGGTLTSGTYSDVTFALVGYEQISSFRDVTTRTLT